MLSEKDLEYYERLVSHIGPAARYQFYAELFGNRVIPGLETKLAAIKGKMGGYNCYLFSISPDYLLKIAFVSHRCKDQQSDNTYQRMVAKSRLTKIRQYISKKGTFPTNIVLSFEMPKKNCIEFHHSSQEGEKDNGMMGWLTLKPSYGSAWVIDGQHRLYAYSGHEFADSSVVTVLAFEGLPPGEQAKLFVDINHEQKSVKKSHLFELFASLRWDSKDPKHKIDAITSKVVSELDKDYNSPFSGRIQRADDIKTATRCLTVQTLCSTLNRGELYIEKQRSDGSIIAYGPLWASDNSQDTVDRTVIVINKWFDILKSKAGDWVTVQYFPPSPSCPDGAYSSHPDIRRSDDDS